MTFAVKDRPSLKASIGFTPERRDGVLPAARLDSATVVQLNLVRARKRVRMALEAVMGQDWFLPYRQRVQGLPDTFREQQTGMVLRDRIQQCQAWVDLLPSSDHLLLLAEAQTLWDELLTAKQALVALLAASAAADESASQTTLNRACPDLGHHQSRNEQNQAVTGLVDLSTNKRKHRLTQHGPSRRVRMNCADAVSALAKHSLNGSLAFLTVTLPVVVHRALNASKRRKLIRRFLEEADREFNRRTGQELLYAGAMEINPSMWKERKIVGFHWHFAIRNRISASSPWVFKVGELEDILHRQILNATGLDVDCSASLNIQAAGKKVAKEIGKIRTTIGVTGVEASAGALSRYLSKGCTDLANEIAEAGNADLLPPPGRKGWVYYSHSVGALVQQEMQERRQQWNQGMLDFLERNLEAFEQAGIIADLYRCPSIELPDGGSLFGGAVWNWTSEAKRSQALRWCRDRYVPGRYRKPAPPPHRKFQPEDQQQPPVSIPVPAA